LYYNNNNNNYYYYIRLMAFLPSNRGKLFHMLRDFNEARDDGVAVPSAGPYTKHLQLAPDR